MAKDNACQHPAAAANKHNTVAFLFSFQRVFGWMNRYEMINDYLKIKKNKKIIN